MCIFCSSRITNKLTSHSHFFLNYAIRKYSNIINNSFIYILKSQSVWINFHIHRPPDANCRSLSRSQIQKKKCISVQSNATLIETHRYFQHANLALTLKIRDWIDINQYRILYLLNGNHISTNHLFMNNSG